MAAFDAVVCMCRIHNRTLRAINHLSLSIKSLFRFNTYRRFVTALFVFSRIVTNSVQYTGWQLHRSVYKSYRKLVAAAWRRKFAFMLANCRPMCVELNASQKTRSIK